MNAKEIDRTDPSLWVYRPGHHKTEHKDKDRAVFIGARAQEVTLRRILKVGPGGLLFPTTRGALCHAVHLGCKRVKVSRWSPNQVRHLVATEVRSKYGLEAAQVLLGHAVPTSRKPTPSARLGTGCRHRKKDRLISGNFIGTGQRE